MGKGRLLASSRARPVREDLVDHGSRRDAGQFGVPIAGEHGFIDHMDEVAQGCGVSLGVLRHRALPVDQQLAHARARRPSRFVAKRLEGSRGRSGPRRRFGMFVSRSCPGHDYRACRTSSAAALRAASVTVAPPSIRAISFTLSSPVMSRSEDVVRPPSNSLVTS